MESPLWEERQGKDDDGAEEAPVAEEREDEHAAADGHLGQQHHPRVEELHQHHRCRRVFHLAAFFSAAPTPVSASIDYVSSIAH
jgi:hypothetical protein